MLTLPEEIDREGWKKPYVVSEFGPRGHWQVAKTPWKVPLEDDANAKADFYIKAYQRSVSGQPACFGSYVFYWAHKQEKTHTWYGMFLPDGSRTPAIDAMTFLWTGRWPSNRCPSLVGKKLTIAAEPDAKSDDPGRSRPGAKLRCSVEVSDAEGDPLQITWELHPDVADHPGVGGDWEPSVEPIAGAIVSTSDEGRSAVVQLPSRPGKYRLFAYARDGHGNATTANSPILTEYPAPRAWQPDPAEWEKLRRSLTLLQSSTPNDRKTVRILFYGQSITQQAWWREVERYLRSTYTNANLIIENRAIGGHSSQLLVKTAEADLYPFRPDLVIFHVYGSHTDYEQIIKNLRERTCADVIIQTDHITRDSALTEVTDPAKLSPNEWDAWMNHAFLPQTASKFGACRADIHERWRSYLRDHNLKASDLLRDGVHLNGHGEWLMAELLKPYLAPLPIKPGYDPLNNEIVSTLPFGSTNNDSVARFEVEGTRADLVFHSDANRDISVLIDGKHPSELPNLYGFTRVSAFPNSDWPILLKVGFEAPLVAEDWSLEITSASADGSACSFSLRGSKTGFDGSGVSTNRFVSNSGRIAIEPGDWNLAYALKVFKRPLPEKFVVTWKSILHGLDTVTASPSINGEGSIVTIADGLAPGRHSIEVRGVQLSGTVKALRAFRPPAK